MEAKIHATFPDAKVDLIKGGRGDFIVHADGKLLWHRKEQNLEFPDPDHIVQTLQSD